MQQPEEHNRHDCRRQCPEQQSERGDAFALEHFSVLKNPDTRRIGRVGNHRQATARHRACDERVFQFVRMAVHQRAEIGERGVVGNRGQARRAKKQRTAAEALEQWF